MTTNTRVSGALFKKSIVTFSVVSQLSKPHLLQQKLLDIVSLFGDGHSEECYFQTEFLIEEGPTYTFSIPKKLSCLDGL